jgi:hypothetical protein
VVAGGQQVGTGKVVTFQDSGAIRCRAAAQKVDCLQADAAGKGGGGATRMSQSGTGVRRLQGSFMPGRATCKLQPVRMASPVLAEAGSACWPACATTCVCTHDFADLDSPGRCGW